MPLTMKGKVVRFDDSRGFGFIESTDGKTVFVHYTQIVDNEPFKSLKVGQEVEFDLYETDLGWEGKDVKKL